MMLKLINNAAMIVIKTHLFLTLFCFMSWIEVMIPNGIIISKEAISEKSSMLIIFLISVFGYLKLLF